jgi:hypothetical protein
MQLRGWGGEPSRHREPRLSHALTMFVVTEAKAAMIRTAYEQRGEFSAAVLIGVIVVILVTLGFLGLR